MGEFFTILVHILNAKSDDFLYKNLFLWGEFLTGHWQWRELDMTNTIEILQICLHPKNKIKGKVAHTFPVSSSWRCKQWLVFLDSNEPSSSIICDLGIHENFKNCWFVHCCLSLKFQINFDRFRLWWFWMNSLIESISMGNCNQQKIKQKCFASLVARSQHIN